MTHTAQHLKTFLSFSTRYSITCKIVTPDNRSNNTGKIPYSNITRPPKNHYQITNSFSDIHTTAIQNHCSFQLLHILITFPNTYFAKACFKGTYVTLNYMYHSHTM